MPDPDIQARWGIEPARVQRCRQRALKRLCRDTDDKSVVHFIRDHEDWTRDQVCFVLMIDNERFDRVLLVQDSFLCQNPVYVSISVRILSVELQTFKHSFLCRGLSMKPHIDKFMSMNYFVWKSSFVIQFGLMSLWGEVNWRGCLI